MREYDAQLLERARLLIDHGVATGKVVFTREDYNELVELAYGMTFLQGETRTVTMNLLQATMMLGMAKRTIVKKVKDRLTKA